MGSLKGAVLASLVLGPALAGAQTQDTTYQFEYDAVGNVTKVTDPRGLQTTQTWDALNRPVQRSLPPPAPGGGRANVTTTYDGQDQLRSVTDPRGLVTSYTTDGLGNTTQQQSPDTGTTNTTYDAAGNVSTRTDARGKVTTYSYDALNRVTQLSYAGGVPTVLEYDGGLTPQPGDIGRRTRMTDESGATRYRYDGFGNVVAKTQSSTVAGQAKDQTVLYGYGATGRLETQTYPSGLVLGYSYDVAGRITGLTLTTTGGSSVLMSAIRYQPFGPVSGWTWGNGTAYTRSYDLNGRLTQLPLGATTGAGTTPNGLTRTVTYDPASRITGYVHSDTNGSAGSGSAQGANQTFGYDDRDRLTSYLPSATSQTYSYDANGNRTAQTLGGTSYTHSIDGGSNRLLSSTGPTPTTNSYDAAGNLIGDGTVTYAYSDRGRLASTTRAGVTTSYTYNGLGQRVAKAAGGLPGGGLRYVYDEQEHLLGEYDGAGNALTETVYLGDTPVGVVKAGVAYYVYADQIDTPRVVTDTGNLMVWRWDQADPFGVTMPDGNPSGLGEFVYNARFPGQTYDAETGKHYNANRDYDPATGRYVQSDPIGLDGGINTYAYAEGNPLSYVDPNGLVVQLCRRPVNIDWVGGANAYLPNHNWIRTDTKEAGMGGVYPIPGQGCSDSPGVQTQTINHSGQGNAPGAVCVTVPDVDEQCVNRAITPGQATGRWMPWNQCQSFARETLYDCSTLGPTTPYIGYPNVSSMRRRP